MSSLKQASFLRRQLRVPTYPRVITARYSQKGFNPPARIDFVAVERKWQAKRYATITKIPEDWTIVQPGITKELEKRIFKAVQPVYNALVIHEHYGHPSRPPVVDMGATDQPEKISRSELINRMNTVHIPPPRPIVGEMETNQEMALWRGVQEFISTMTCKPASVNLEELQRLLDPLITMIIEVDTFSQLRYIKFNILYHSMRDILRIIAVSNSSFAEECWVALHYGHKSWQSPLTAEEKANSKRRNPGVLTPEMRRKLKEQGLLHLPREGQPDSLPSILAQPFPKVEPPHVLEHLRKYTDEPDFKKDIK